MKIPSVEALQESIKDLGLHHMPALEEGNSEPFNQQVQTILIWANQLKASGQLKAKDLEILTKEIDQILSHLSQKKELYLQEIQTLKKGAAAAHAYLKNTAPSR